MILGAARAAVPFPSRGALSVPPSLSSGTASWEVTLALVRDRSVRSPLPVSVAEVCGLRARVPEVPAGPPCASASALTSSSGPSSVVERSPRGAKDSRLSEEDEDKASVAGSE